MHNYYTVSFVSNTQLMAKLNSPLDVAKFITNWGKDNDVAAVCEYVYDNPNWSVCKTCRLVNYDMTVALEAPLDFALYLTESKKQFIENALAS